MEKLFPRVTIGAVIFNNENKLLLLKSNKWHGKYIIPCGHVEFGETLQQAVQREVKDETGLSVENIKFIRYGEMINSNEFFDKKRHFVSINFQCQAVNKSIKLNSEAQSYVWLTLDQALHIKTDSLTKASLEKLKNFHK